MIKDSLSIWGREDSDTVKILNRLELKGRWLNLAAGDGRYNSLLLSKVEHLVVADIDSKALKKLLMVKLI